MMLAFAVCAAAASAFDSGKWLAERGDDSDMLRLRTAYGECVKKVEAPAENVMFPLETYPDGTVKSRLRAGRAYMFLDTGFIWGENIRVEQYKADGKTIEGFLTADNCIVDRKSKSGWVQGNAHMDWDGTSIKGRGIYFRSVVSSSRYSRRRRSARSRSSWVRARIFSNNRGYK